MWGSAFLLTKVALSGLDPDLIVAGRLLVACVLLVPLAYWHSRRSGGRVRWSFRLLVFLVLIAIFGNVLPFLLIAWGQQRIDSGLAGILMAVMPLVTLGLAHFFVPGERLTPHRVSGFLLGFCGVAVLLGADGAMAAQGRWQDQLIPMISVLMGAVCYALSAILARLRPPSTPVTSAAVTTMLAAGMMLPALGGADLFGPAPGERWVPMGAILALGVFSTAWASVIYFHLIQSAGPAFVSQLNYLIPLWALLMGIIFMSEQPSLTDLYALVLIFCGILVTQMESWLRPLSARRGGVDSKS